MKDTSDGGYIFAGQTIYENFDADIYRMKLDEKGDWEWSSSIRRNLNEPDSTQTYRANDVADHRTEDTLLTVLALPSMII
jgi:hypothetical protein